MQKITNDIRTNASKVETKAPVTDAIRSAENLVNVFNFSRRNLNNITIIKKDGTKIDIDTKNSGTYFLQILDPDENHD